MEIERIKKSIRNVPDFPKPGIQFKDITPILQDPELFGNVIDIFYDRYKSEKIDVIVSIESRGFIFAAPLAIKLGCSLAIARKPGKLPYETVSAEYSLEYGVDTLEIKAVDSFLGIIDISEDLKTSILTLSINASEPNLAAKINQALIEELDAHQRKYNKTKTSDTKQFIEERILNTEKELMAAEENLKVFMDRNRRIENSPALQLEQQRLGREVTVLTGVFTTLKQQLETTKIEEVKESDYVIILDPPEVPLQRSKPNKKGMVLLAGFFGIGFGIIIGFIREYITRAESETKEKFTMAKSLIYDNLLELILLKKKK